MSFECNNWFSKIDCDSNYKRIPAELLENCLFLKSCCIEVVSFASKFNFENIDGNGYLSLVAIVAKFSEMLDHQMYRRELKLKKYLLVSRCLRTMFEILLDFKEKCDKDIATNKRYLLASNYEVAFKGFTYTQKQIKELSVIFGSLGPFWLHSSFQKIFDEITIGMTLFKTSFPKSLFHVRNKKSRGLKFAKVSISGKTLDLLDLCDSKIHSFYVKHQYRRTSVKSVTKNVEVDASFQILHENVTIKIIENKRCNRLRFRYIYDRNTIEQRKYLLLHVHGGCFIKSTPDAHEVYLYDWSHKLPNATIVALDYSKSKFPAGLQDLLDFYLWLTTSNDVSAVLGYKPEKVVLSGDSAGANLVVALYLVLSDIHKLYTSANIIFPVGILGVYGVFKVLPVMSPSRLMSGIDPILYQTLNLSVLYCYSGVNSEKQVHSRKQTRKHKRWFQRSDEKIKDIFSRITDVLKHPYASPLLYPSFDDIPKIPLSLISCQFCPLLDDSIEMAHAWQGPTQLEIFGGLPHGFLNFILKSNEAKIASDKCVDYVKQFFCVDQHKS